jgi:hypothetical protein
MHNIVSQPTVDLEVPVLLKLSSAYKPPNEVYVLHEDGWTDRTAKPNSRTVPALLHQLL